MKFFRHALCVLEYGREKEGQIDENDTTLEPAATFSVKWRPPTNQIGLPFSAGPAVEAAAELPQAAPQPQPTEAPPKRPASEISAIQRVRMVTTGHMAGAGNVVRNIDDAAALVAPIRKSAQELVFAVTTGEDGTLIEIHRFSRGTRSALYLLHPKMRSATPQSALLDQGPRFSQPPRGMTDPSRDDMGGAKWP